MTSTVYAAGASAAGAALLTAVLAPLVLTRLPEPADGEGKPRYRDLATVPFVGGCAVLSGLAAAIAWLIGPPTIQPFWAVLSVLGVLLAAVDARTTWLPLPLTRAAWLAMIVAAAVVLALGGGSAVAPRHSRGSPGRRDLPAGLAGLPGRLRVRRRAVRAAGRLRDRRPLLVAADLGTAARQPGGCRTRAAASGLAPHRPVPVRAVDAARRLSRRGRGLGRLTAEHVQGGPGVRVGCVWLGLSVVGADRSADRDHIPAGPEESSERKCSPSNSRN